MRLVPPSTLVERPLSLSVRPIRRAVRARAGARLDRAATFPIVLVGARGGFERSAVVREWLDIRGLSYRRIRIDPVHADMLGVLRALGDTVADAVPVLSSSLAIVYERLAAAPDAAQELAIWAAGCLGPVSLRIVFDVAAGTICEPVATMLSTLMDRTGGRSSWIVLADDCTGFPIVRWMAEKRTGVPLDETDLAFSADDAWAAAAEYADSATRRDVQALCELTAGSPAALALALAGNSASAGAAVPRDAAGLYAFLIEAMLAAVSRRTRAFIENTCFFTAFDDLLLECAGLDDVGDIVAQLCDDIGIVERSADGTYEYDPLVRAAVAAYVDARGDGSIGRIAARSGAAYECDGNYGAAIDIYRAVEDEDALCTLLGAHGYALIDRGESASVVRALAAVRHDVLVRFGGALAVKASLESLHGNSDIAEAWFRLAIDRISDEPLRNEIVYRFAVDLVRRERPDAIDLLEPIVRTIDPAVPWAAALQALLAAAYASNGRTADAVAMMERALLLLPQVQSRGIRAKIVYQAGFVALHAGDARAAKAFAHQAYREAMKACSYDVAARASSVLYCIAIDDEDDVAAARAYVEQLADASGRAGSRELLLYATLCRYEIEAYAGNITEIERLNETLASLEVAYSVLATETLLPSQALQATWGGDFARAYRMLEASVDRQVSEERRALRYAEIALYAAAAELRHEAAVAAEEAMAILHAGTPPGRMRATSHAYIALAFVLLERHGRASKSLRDPALDVTDMPRIALLVRAVGAVAERFRSGGSDAELVAALDACDAADMGGIARMIEALPLPARARRLVPLSAAERESVYSRRHAAARRSRAKDAPRSITGIA